MPARWLTESLARERHVRSLLCLPLEMTIMHTEHPIDPANLRRAFNRIVADELRTVVAWLGVMYVFYAALHLLMLPPHQAAPMSILAVISALILGLLYQRWSQRTPVFNWAHPYSAGIALLVMINIFAHIVVTGQSHEALLLTYVIIGIGVLLLDVRWVLGLNVLIWISGALVMLLVDADANLQQYIGAMLAASALGAIAHSIRRRTLRHLGTLRWRDAERQDQLATAVIAAQQSEERFRKFSGAAFEGLLFHEQGQVIDMNQTLLDMLGYTLGEVCEKTVFDLITPESHAVVRENLAAQAEDAFEVVGRRKDGTTFPVDVCAKSLPVGGRTLRVVAVRDITQRKQIEVEREQVIEELDSFAHTVAHDLKNPTSLVLSYAQMLADDADTLGPEHTHTIVTQIAQQSIRLVTIIDELLLLAQVRHGEVPLEPLEMNTVITNLRFRIGPLQADTGAGLDIPDSWPEVLGYGPWVEEVWYNYVCNAMKYGGAPPQVTLGATPQTDGMVRFWVRDNGAGITAEEQAQLFKPFQRLQGVGTKGYGLGLSIAQRIINRLGGVVGVESTPGAGSTFFFTLRDVAAEDDGDAAE